MNLTKETLNPLVEYNAPLCISIYIPMARSGKETQKNPIRFKNACKEVEELLNNAGYEDTDTNIILEKLSAFKMDNEFFQNQLDGLAVFLSDNFERIYKLPVRFEHKVEIGNTFNLRPLLQTLQNDQSFYILTISKELSRLFKAGKFHLSEVILSADTPTSFKEAMKYDEPENQLQYQTVSSADGGRTAIYHGHSESDKMNKDLRRYFRMLDLGVGKAIADHNLPVVLAGLEYLHPIYKDASNLPHIIPTGIYHNPLQISEDELHAKAWEIIERETTSPVDEAITQYQDLLGTQKTNTDVSTLPLAASSGRVDTLLVDKNSTILGQVDTNQQEVVLGNGQDQSQDIDLINFSIQQTILNGGDVYIIDEEQLTTEESPIAAIMRY